QQGRALGHGLGVELERGSGNDAQGALAANEEIAQIVSSVVLAKAAQAVPDFALGRDDFKPQREITRIAIAQDLRPACIGGQIAPYGAASLGNARDLTLGLEV